MKPFVVANWKMNPTKLSDAKLIFNSLKDGLKSIRGLEKKAEVVVCPPFLYLAVISDLKSNIKLGGQDCFWEEEGPFTGEVSPLMLKNLGCQYVIVGHSERRGFLNETNQMANKKIQKALISGLKPILCVGESKKEKAQGMTQNVLRKQLEKSLKKTKKKDVKNIILAYEPVWAIGTGNPCSIDEANVTRIFLKKIISQKFSHSVCQEINILYGGSVDSSNARSFIKDSGFNGLLIGGASLKPEEFIQLVKNIAI